MSNLVRILRGLLKPSRRRDLGQGLVEYALIVALVAVVVISMLAFLGPGIADVLSEVADEVQGGSPSSPPRWKFNDSSPSL